MASEVKHSSGTILKLVNLMLAKVNDPKTSTLQLKAQLKLLSTMLTKAGTSCDADENGLSDISKTLSGIKANFEVIVTKFKAAEDKNSQQMKDKISDLRTKAYAGCAASVLGGPAAIAIC